MQGTAQLLSSVFEALVDRVEGIIDEEEKVSHQQVAEKVTQTLASASRKQGVEAALMRPPIVQSGGKYSQSVGSDSRQLVYDVVHLGVGVVSGGLKAYCARSLLIEPTDSISRLYHTLLDLHSVAVGALTTGTALKEVYSKVSNALSAKDPELLKHLPNVLGSCNESVIARDSEAVAAEGEVYLLDLALLDIPRPAKFKSRDAVVSLIMGDTVEVRVSGGVVLTDIPRKYQDVSYFLEDGEEQPEKIELPEKTNRGVVRSSRLRSQASKQNIENEQSRKLHQKELRDRKLEELRDRFSSMSLDNTDNSKGLRSLSELRSYPSVDAFPEAAKKGHVFVDPRHESIIVPLHRQLVPFHVSTIKNVSKSEEGSYCYLRINFFHQGLGNLMRDTSFALPEPSTASSIYLKELTLRSSNSKNLLGVFRMIKELIKRVKTKEIEAKQKRDLVDQEKLIIIKGKRPVLQDLTIRPNLSGKKTVGFLEAHQNGLRFQSNRGEVTDIIYKNVKHAIFQPVENDLVVLLHFHLHNAVMVGSKKTTDIQFYSEAGIQSDDLEMRRRGGQDLDEIQQEQRERKYKEKLNHDFKHFVEAVQSVSNEELEFDIPYRELGFSGVPHKSNVFLMPSVNCLVNISDQPSFVITLNEIEVAHLERVQFALRNFDLVFVFKDYARPPAKITNIPAEFLEPIKDWLNDIDILYSESTNPLNWGNIMKEITRDLNSFADEGGWNFLQDESDSEAGSTAKEVEEMEVDSEFSEEDAESEDDESDFSEDDESEAEAPESSEEEDEEGMDWDELEEHARRQDSRKRPPIKGTPVPSKKTKK
jgi:nucleosome binding factor SPN SPT16 subunit